ncbi:MAG: Anthranilate synthase, amidotransferase component @ Para-aminobenzoate synthase, amidotransferase component, partial [uncultured Solirubrobacteraceae bacterium]
ERAPRPGRRQLRLLHLQPRPVPGGAGGGGRGRAQRRRHGRRAARARARPGRRLARAVHAGRGGHLDRGHAALPGGRDPHPRRLPRAPVARPGVRRACRAPRPRARQDDGDRARRRGDLRRPARAPDRRPLPLARGRSGVPAARARGGLARRRRADGRAPPRAAGRRRAVPPRVGAHARRAPAAGELPCL